MLDTAIATVLQGYLTALLPSFNGFPVGVVVPDVGVQADAQVRQAGIPDQATIFCHQIHTKRIGWMQRVQGFVMVDGVSTFTRMQKQRMETQFQFSALVPQSPGDATAPMPSDILDAAVSILQSSYVIDDLNTTYGAQVLRVTDVPSFYIEGDDRNQIVNNPTFDIIVIHNRVFSVVAPVVDSTVVQIKRV